MSLRFFDNQPINAVFLAPSETPEREIDRMQIFTDGSRAMSSIFWKTTYRILPVSADGRTATGEAYWIADSNSPILNIEFQRDRDGRVSREILLQPSPQNQIGIQGWYEYTRDELGRLIEITYHSKPGVDGRWFTDDDFALSRVELNYESGERNPREARVFYNSLGLPVRSDYEHRGGLSVTFVYDTEGRLTGGVRQDYWPTYFSVTSGACSAISERLFVLLLGAHGGPWHPFSTQGRGIRSTTQR
jgi:hypothetical protein